MLKAWKCRIQLARFTMSPVSSCRWRHDPLRHNAVRERLAANPNAGDHTKDSTSTNVREALCLLWV